MSQIKEQVKDPINDRVIGYNYDVEELFQLLEEEFGARKVVQKFARAVRGKSQEEIEGIAEKFWSEYGRAWMKRTLELGEKYQDRAYQVAKAAAERTGLYHFGVIPQRFLEIAYLAIQEFSALPVLQCTAQALRYQVPGCTIYRELQEQCGEEVASRMPCRHACLTALRVLHEELGLPAGVSMLGSMAKDQACQFEARRG